MNGIHRQYTELSLPSSIYLFVLPTWKTNTLIEMPEIIILLIDLRGCKTMKEEYILAIMGNN
jgi:hypothetical protein